MTAVQDAAGSRYRWWILAVLVLSSTINYLDRQSLATLAPLLRADFHLSREQYGWILGAFSLAYAANAPFAGLLIDRIGLKLEASVPGIDEATFQSLAAAAKKDCPLSKALASVPEITLTAVLHK